MRGILLAMRTLSDFKGRELCGLRFGHAQIESHSRRGFVDCDHALERRRSFYEHNGLLPETRLAAYHRLDRKIGNVDRGKSHKKPNGKLKTKFRSCLGSFRFHNCLCEVAPLYFGLETGCKAGFIRARETLKFVPRHF